MADRQTDVYACSKNQPPGQTMEIKKYNHHKQGQPNQNNHKAIIGTETPPDMTPTHADGDLPGDSPNTPARPRQ